LELTVHVPPGSERTRVLGVGDRNLKLIREALGIRMVTRDANIRLLGERSAVLAARDVLTALAAAAEAGRVLTRQDVHELIGQALSAADGDAPASGIAPTIGFAGPEPLPAGPAWGEHLSVYASGTPVRAKTANQQAYLNAIRELDVVFGVGPAGTGKTYLAVAAAVHMLKSGRAKKIILVRPAVEAGEKLGFLPGDLQQKVNPYLRPLLDALNDMIDYTTLTRFIASDVIEIVPLAFMRGRTLNRAVIILDEAQNTTRSQMKMFLTRMGAGSKVIVTGDPSQTDLEDPSASGLAHALTILRKTPGIALCGLDETDIVRNPLVARIVEAYARFEGALVAMRGSENGAKSGGRSARSSRAEVKPRASGGAERSNQDGVSGL
jgi:phosphate starvation-inducible PhoH-like protein